MEDKIVLANTSILIDYFKKNVKYNSMLAKLFQQGYDFHISIITKYEIYSGATLSQLYFWDDLLKGIKVLPFDQSVVNVAVTTNTHLKRKQIDLADLFIAATAIASNLPFATLNRKHFKRIDDLKIIV